VPSLWFPEGKRSASGELLRFHGGVFRLATECGCAVVPIVVEGTRTVYRGWRVAAFPGAAFPGRIVIRVLDPVSLADVDGDADGLRAHVYGRMRRVLMELRGQPSEEEAT
jgi:1-acyl-sn-glycerol-3-phosphate acyltransferase